jgi:nitric oxide reductase large subunit
MDFVASCLVVRSIYYSGKTICVLYLFSTLLVHLLLRYSNSDVWLWIVVILYKEGSVAAILGYLPRFVPCFKYTMCHSGFNVFSH